MVPSSRPRCDRSTLPFSRVLHDWDDERCLTILRKCRAAMDTTARLAIVEFVLPERVTEDAALLPAALLDLIMLAYAGNRERTESEFRSLLEQAGHISSEHPLSHRVPTSSKPSSPERATTRQAACDRVGDLLAVRSAHLRSRTRGFMDHARHVSPVVLLANLLRNGSGATIRRGVVAVTHADAFVGDHGYGAGGEVAVEVFEGEVELLPGRLSVDVELD
jgi:hypothetical protein